MTDDQTEVEVMAATETEAPAASLDARVAAWRAERDREYTRLRQQARAVYRAMDGWAAVRSEEEWQATCVEAREQYLSGRFLVERMGAERYLDPRLMATLWGMRQRLIEDLGASGTHELMLVDAVMLSYAHLLRFHEMVGNFALQIEHEAFGAEGPSARLEWRYGREVADRLRVEENLERVRDQLLPLMDRAQRMMLRALRELRRPAAPSVAIGQAGQVNVAAVQQNTTQPPEWRGRRLRGRARTAPESGEQPCAACGGIPSGESANE